MQKHLSLHDNNFNKKSKQKNEFLSSVALSCTRSNLDIVVHLLFWQLTLNSMTYSHPALSSNKNIVISHQTSMGSLEVYRMAFNNLFQLSNIHILIDNLNFMFVDL